jgi:outer membrane murein-binding lipoprotein Lpp
MNTALCKEKGKEIDEIESQMQDLAAKKEHLREEYDKD